MLREAHALGIDRRDGAIARQCNANGLAQAVHAVGGVRKTRVVNAYEYYIFDYPENGEQAAQ